MALALIAAWATGDMLTAALLPIVMTVGHVLEERSMMGSDEAVKALGRLTQADARRMRADGGYDMVPTTALREGDMLELRAGERLPADGIVREGLSSLDMASLTGESVPIDVRAGDPALAGAMNIDGLLKIELTRVGDDTTLGKIITLMREAEDAKPPVTRLLDRYAGQYMALVLLVAAGTWFLTNNVPAMLAVLVASCPCALVLATPATSVAAIVVAARHGILIKGSAFLEHLADVTAVVFDKTGTLTTGALQLAEARPMPGVDEATLRRLAGALGAASNHPLSRAAATSAPEFEQLSLQNAREIGGFGVTGLFEGQEAALGRADLFERLGVKAPPAPVHDGPIAGVSLGDKFLGWLLFFDQLRPGAEEAVKELKSLGVERILLLTGDRVAVANHVAAEVGIDEIDAGMLPEDKLERVRSGNPPRLPAHGGRRRHQRQPCPSRRRRRRGHGRAGGGCGAGLRRPRAGDQRPAPPRHLHPPQPPLSAHHLRQRRHRARLHFRPDRARRRGRTRGGGADHCRGAAQRFDLPRSRQRGPGDAVR